jgi:ABC-2 type transport system permease protein
MTAIYLREMRAYFTTPIGYIFMAVFLAVSAFVFSLTTLLIQSSDVSTYFLIIMFVFIIILPLLTMKSLAEERKSRTEQLLLTSPVTLTGMIAAKFLAAMTMFVGALLVSSLNFLVILKFLPEDSSFNLAVLAGNLISTILVGMCFIAIGIFVSSLTENQLIAAIVTIGILVFLLFIGFLNSLIDSYVIRYIISWVSIYNRYGNFSNGIFDFNAIVYYFSISIVFLFLTIRVYERRRWN